MGLAAIRTAANLTQVELAGRMGIKQAVLSTLADYLAAAGAHDVVISAKLGDVTVEVPLSAPVDDAASI